LSESMAGNIVSYREQNGAFKNRQEILKVTRLGPKVFEQAAGFLKISNGDNPLDASSVHPEAYPVVKNILEKNSREMNKVIGDKPFLSSLAANDYVMDGFGEPTVRDIIQELEKPGRDPRPEFKTASFKDGVEKVSDLKEGMILEGVITNVTNFGAFVDIGVHQDGLVHISVIADKFVKDPHDVVKTGEVVKVKVMDVDVKRNRIALSMRLIEEVERKSPALKREAGTSKVKSNQTYANKSQANSSNGNNHHKNKVLVGNTAMAEAFAKLKK